MDRDEWAAQLRADLAAALKDAIRARDAVAVSALRTTLSAIANAEAVAGAQAAAAVGSPHFAGPSPVLARARSPGGSSAPPMCARSCMPR